MAGKTPALSPADRHDLSAGAIGIARGTKGAVTPAGEKFCEILRQISSEADRDKSKPLSKISFGRAEVDATPASHEEMMWGELLTCLCRHGSGYSWSCGHGWREYIQWFATWMLIGRGMANFTSEIDLKKKRNPLPV